MKANAAFVFVKATESWGYTDPSSYRTGRDWLVTTGRILYVCPERPFDKPTILLIVNASGCGLEVRSVGVRPERRYWIIPDKFKTGVLIDGRNQRSDRQDIHSTPAWVQIAICF